MTTHKVRQIMADKNRARTTQEKAGMASLLARIKEQREQAIKAQPEDVKTVEGVRAGAHPAVLA